MYLDSRVISIDPYTPSLVTKGGRTYSGDLIVASDGMPTHSNPSSAADDDFRSPLNGTRGCPGTPRSSSPNRPNGISSDNTSGYFERNSGIGGNHNGA